MDNFTAGEQVTNVLREKIFSGEIQDGTELTQTWVAEQLGVSRMPIREALQNLELEGFIERLDNRHTRVIGFGEEEGKSRLKVLSSLEKEAALVLMKTGKPAGKITKLQDIVKSSFSKDKELYFHTLLFMESEDRYLNQVFNRMIKPTLQLFIHHRKSSSSIAREKLLEITSALGQKEFGKIEKLLDEYYTELSIR